jgi:hypothetical protein
MKQYRVKLQDNHSANEDQIINGYLGNAFGNGKIMEYTRGHAIKKARMFGGKIELAPLNIDGVEILSLEIELYGERTDEHEIDLGALYLSNEGREYVLDATQSYTTVEGGFTKIKVDLEVDFDTFPKSDHPYDLTATDLFDNSLKASFYIASDLSVESISLFVKQDGCTKAIDVIQD